MNTFKKLKQFYWSHKRYFFISIIFLIVTTAITLVYPIVLQKTIDDVIIAGKYDFIPFLILAYLTLMVIKGVATYIQQYTGDMFGIIAMYKLRKRLYEKLQFLPFRFYDNAKTGDIMSRLTADVQGFRHFLSYGFTEVIRFILFVGISMIVMFTYSIRLTIVTLFALPFLMVVVHKFEKKVHPAFRKVRQSFGQLNTKVQENVSGIKTVKSLSKEDFEIERFHDFNLDFRDRNIFNSNIWAKYFPLMEFIGNICIIVLLSYGGFLVINNELNPGELVAFYSLTGYIIMPIMNLGFIINMFSQAKASGERLLEILEEPNEIKEKENPIKHIEIKGEVTFNNVSLKYAGDEKAALNNITFSIPSGSVVGLIGATGSGKTSVTQLIPRFYDVTEGEVLIDGINVKDFDFYTLRSQIGFVLQEPFLFSSTIKANIAYGKPDATMEEIMDAAKRADAHNFIMELPEGYDTLLGERGMGLSGGQRQRISIARAICMNPKILILDDATSAVDMETEFAIQQAMQAVMKDRTTFIIAHRISSIKHADQILVFEEGKIVERGVHDELIKNGGPYERIYNIQYQDQVKILQQAVNK
ncbi:ABC transporter ATP-binding protein [Pallidibacillus thermolactis]|uniref:ABC transporter ATP-binding protein n=1 Tax=Pallidibacillus thermolactis TaxID=251051 RepID=UPI0021D9C184|nr:ABC transporter ATP-binding protein [Pallidibacillus thermolactis]MCU9600415.1 ABC transporter ATP-binding protein/permease [Pallidibacillus thermolactis subsp. kokeshiiformis]